MNKDNIVPDVIDHYDDITSAELNITYPNGIEVRFGSQLTPTEVKDEPTVTWAADPDKYYLLVMTDPDAAPEIREGKHWLVGNIRGNNLSSGEIFAEYVGSRSPKTDGLHRYIFLVYEQPGRIAFDEPPRTSKTSRANRIKFSIRKFAKKYNLGNPIAGNYFKAQWDDHLEESNKSMSDH